MMMENPRPEEEKIIKDIKNLFRLKKELDYTAIKDKKNLVRREQEIKKLTVEYSEMLRIFLSMKKRKKSIINQ